MDSGPLQQLLDDLLDRALPGRPELPLLSGADGQQPHPGVGAARMYLGRALKADPALTARLADDVLALLVLDDNASSQLVFPVVAALGRRPVLTHLIAQAGQGGWRTRINACSAAHWVGMWQPTDRRDEIVAAIRQGTLTGAQAQTLLLQDQRQPTWRTNDQIADLWPGLWVAAAEAFVHCGDNDLRHRLQDVFPLNTDHYPPAHRPLVDQARTIAEEQPELFGRLLTNVSGHGT
ncbi:hypothetical protein GCM10010495_70280 [Kitasatospora herbaricolor]|uniref:hypothetical protein n=1 Tax=Kitasatospora herbaricolor TaxID=68217 RepID=UPI0017492975|nr:hypothetical protein [Kitasatospora herbaricolor]MDQ0306395.1 hypothetical protein [Kitasatospora herbaricolor]GGV42596.1 hypothetical protein GCM10010495_70280 [Kitasatospora herbaricolor]